ncbi:MAG: CDP-diacylglycerol diphosphatase, partial [Usitatibacter sp.]
TARGQDQLHIHIACVSPMLDLVLSKNADVIASEWSPVTVADRPYLARRIMGAEVLEANAVRLLRTEWADSPRDPGNDTFIIVGRTFASGPGVIVLVGTGWPGGETLLDSTCAVSP